MFDSHSDQQSKPVVAMLLDNHHGPDPRIAMESEILAREGLGVRVIAWDRRTSEMMPPLPEQGDAGEQIVRISVPAPPGGGVSSLLRSLRFGLSVLTRRKELLRGASVLVVHDVYLLPLGWLVALIQRLPFVYDAHEEFALMETGRYSPRLLNLVTWIETTLARRAALVVVPGQTRLARWAQVGISPVVLSNAGPSAWHDQRSETPVADPEWHIVYCGTLGEDRRLDLLIGMAQRRSDLRVAVAGSGRMVATVSAAADATPNLEYLGHVLDPARLIRSARSVYYGLDPSHPYAASACPNTLYQGIRAERPVVYFGGGEIAKVNETFNVALCTEPTSDGIASAVDSIITDSHNWDFQAAWTAFEEAAEDRTYALKLRTLASSR